MSDVTFVDSDDDVVFDEAGDSDFDIENEAPKKVPAIKNKSSATAKKASATSTKALSKKTTVRKTAPTKKALADKSNNDDENPLSEIEFSSDAKRGQQEKTVEERYQKKTQLEHILLRPDTYSKYT